MSGYKLVRASTMPKNAKEARKKDKSFYGDKDDQTGEWGVFGDSTGFMYKQCENKSEADKAAKDMNKNYEANASVETAAEKRPGVAGDAWFKGLTKKQQDAYIKLHPNSKYGKGAKKTGGAGLKPASKVIKKAAPDAEKFDISKKVEKIRSRLWKEYQQRAEKRSRKGGFNGTPGFTVRDLTNVDNLLKSDPEYIKLRKAAGL